MSFIVKADEYSGLLSNCVAIVPMFMQYSNARPSTPVFCFVSHNSSITTFSLTIPKTCIPIPFLILMQFRIQAPHPDKGQGQLLFALV